MRSTTRSALLAVAATLAVLAVAAVGFVYSGIYDVSATSGHTPLVRWLLHTTQERSVAVRAGAVPEPPATDSATLDHGFEHFDAMCVSCHGAPGVERGEPGRGLTPTPPALADEAGEHTSRELFWIVKHGIKMAGMPAYGPTHSDEEIWGIVAFVEELPGMSESEYEAWRARRAVSDSGQADGGHAHAPGTPSHGH